MLKFHFLICCSSGCRGFRSGTGGCKTQTQDASKEDEDRGDKDKSDIESDQAKALLIPSYSTLEAYTQIFKTPAALLALKGKKALSACCTLALASILVVVAIRSADFATLC
jgi:hypothetical protein